MRTLSSIMKRSLLAAFVFILYCHCVWFAMKILLVQLTTRGRRWICHSVRYNINTNRICTLHILYISLRKVKSAQERNSEAVN